MSGHQHNDIINNKAKNRYELTVDGHTAYIDYVTNQTGEVYLTHTEVPPEISGLGVGSELAQKTLERMKRRNRKIAPLCPFIAIYIRKNPEWKVIILEGYNV